MEAAGIGSEAIISFNTMVDGEIPIPWEQELIP
jgi:hypothetical protein